MRAAVLFQRLVASGGNRAWGTRWGQGAHHPEPAGDITAEHAGLQGFYVAAHVGFGVQHVAVTGHLVELLLLLVGEDDVGMESLHHQQGLAQRPGALPQHLQETAGSADPGQPTQGSGPGQRVARWATDLVGLHGDDGAQGEYEGVHVLHVQIVCGDCV